MAPRVAQVAGQGAGVDAGDADHALLAQRVVERAPRAPARGDPGGVADDVPGHPDPRGLGVLVVHAGVADVGSGHHHDLAVVRRVGERLLVARHPGGEHRLTEGLALGAVGLPAEGPAVFEDEQSGRMRDSRRTSFSASRDGSLKDVERGRPYQWRSHSSDVATRHRDATNATISASVARVGLEVGHVGDAGAARPAGRRGSRWASVGAVAR